jgi:hypothetical protein
MTELEKKMHVEYQRSERTGHAVDDMARAAAKVAEEFAQRHAIGFGIYVWNRVEDILGSGEDNLNMSALFREYKKTL